MLTRDQNISTPEQYYGDSLLTKPTTSHSVYNNLTLSAATPLIAVNDMDSEFAKKPEGKALHAAMEAVNIENMNPNIGWGQASANYLANIAGMLINPIYGGLGTAGALLTRSAAGAAERIAPEAVNTFAKRSLGSFLSKEASEKVPETLAQLTLAGVSEKSLEAFAVGAGIGIPQGITENYDQDTGHIKWGGVAKDMGSMGAFGLAIGSIPFAFGLIKGKVNRARMAEPAEEVPVDAFQEAVEKGHITQEQYDWYKAASTETDPKKLNKLERQASQIVGSEGHIVNTATHEVPVEILKAEDIKNLQSAVADQLAGDVPENYKTALSDFIVHNGLDAQRENPKFLDGVRGYIDFMKGKMKEKPRKIVEHNEILDKHLLRSVKENMPFSQKEIMKMIKQSSFESSHIKHLPLIVPENLSKHIDLLEKINQLEKKMKKLGRNKQTEKRIKELNDRLPKILTPKEELQHIRNKLITEKGTPDNVSSTPEYHRLSQLAEVWHNARVLLDRVHMEEEYKRQDALMTISELLVKVEDSNAPRLAKPDNVINYLKERIEGNVYKKESIENIEEKVQEQTSVPSEGDQVLKEQEERIKNIKAKKSVEEFEISSERYREFKSSENVFKNLLSCVLGSVNV